MREFRVGLACGHDLYFEQSLWAPLAGEVVWCRRCRAETEAATGRAPTASDSLRAVPDALAQDVARDARDGLSASLSSASMKPSARRASRATTKPERTNGSHRHCDHDRTKAARSACRRAATPPITASPPVPSSEGPAHPGGVG